MARDCSKAGRMPRYAQEPKTFCIGFYLGKSYSEDNWANGQKETINAKLENVPTKITAKAPLVLLNTCTCSPILPCSDTPSFGFN